MKIIFLDIDGVLLAGRHWEAGWKKPPLPADTVVALDANAMAALWSYLERITEAIATTGIPHKVDVAVPIPSLGAFCAELEGVVRDMARGHRNAEPQLIVFGHVGVGNLHVNVLGPDPADTDVDEAVARLAASHGGSVAAEHGVGRAKTGWLANSSLAADLSAMRSIKKALDPSGARGFCESTPGGL